MSTECPARTSAAGSFCCAPAGGPHEGFDLVNHLVMDSVLQRPETGSLKVQRGQSAPE